MEKLDRISSTASFWFAVGALILLLSRPTLAEGEGRRSYINGVPSSVTDYSPEGGSPGASDGGDWSWGLPIPPSSGEMAFPPYDPEFENLLVECREEIITPQCTDEIFDALVRAKSFSESCCFKVYHNRQCYTWLVEDMLDTRELKPQATIAKINVEQKMSECEALLSAFAPSDDDYYH